MLRKWPTSVAPPVELSNTLLESCLIECGLCSDLLDPTETEAMSFPGCSHTICDKCSTLTVPHENQLKFCPVCRETNGPSNAIEQTNGRFPEGTKNIGQSAKVHALVQDLRSQPDGYSEPEKR